MPSYLIGILISHLLTAIEAALVAAEPTIIDELKLLITKLEKYIESKVPEAAPFANNTLNALSNNLNPLVNAGVSVLNNGINAVADQAEKAQ